MQPIETYAKFKIHQGKVEQFKRALDELVAVVREKDQLTTRYDWFINERSHEAVAIDAYASEAGMFEHQRNAGPTHKALVDYADMSVEFLGLPSAEGRAAVDKFTPRYFAFDGGIGDQTAAAKYTSSVSTDVVAPIEIFTRFKINEGKLDEFKTHARECLNRVIANDPGTLRYDWFYDKANNECIAMDTYKDLASMAAHMKNCKEPHDKLVAVSEMSLEFLGELSADAKDAVAKYSPYILPFHTGLKKYSSGGFQ